MPSPRLTGALLAASLIAANAVFAQEPPPPVPPPNPVAVLYKEFAIVNPEVHGDWTTCDQLKDACEGSTWQEMIDAVTRLKPPRIGLCYAHSGFDASGFPYAANYYVKQSWREGAKGWDGGTGAIGMPRDSATLAASEQAAGELLRQLCISGACCCPDLPPVLPCDDLNSVDAKDPKTGHSCTFPNHCTVPSDWKI